MAVATYNQKFGTQAAVTVTGLNGLANTSTATSNAIDNSTALDVEAIIELTVSGTAAATAWLDVRLLESCDGTNYSTWESARKLRTVDMSVVPQSYHERFVAPQYFKIAIKNNTGAGLAAAGCTLKVTGVSYTGTI